MIQPTLINKINFSALYPNRDNPRMNSCIIIFEDVNKHPYMLFVDRVDSKINVNMVEENINTSYFSWAQSQHFEFSCELMPSHEKIIFQVIDLNPPEPPVKFTLEEAIQELKKSTGKDVEIVWG